MNGYGGVSFSSASLTHEEAARACEALLSEGACAAIMPTVITAPAATFEHVLPILADLIEQPRFAGRLLGVHLEGPFISGLKGAVGTHPAGDVVAPAARGRELLDGWQRLARGNVKLITIAAEVDGAAELCAHAVSMGIACSLGHQLAGRAELAKLANAGASLLTHLGNGCPNQIHRHDNHLWPSLADDRMSAMIIPDGLHLPRDAILTMLRAKGVDRIIVTSDIAPVAGLPEGTYDCFGGVVHVEGRCVRSADRSCLAGSGALMIDCMNHLAALDLRPDPSAPGRRLSLAELEQMGFDNPLRAVGLEPQLVRAQIRKRLAGKAAVEYVGGAFRRV